MRKAAAAAFIFLTTAAALPAQVAEEQAPTKTGLGHELVHDGFVTWFTRSEGFGLSRVTPVMLSPNQYRQTRIDGREYQIDEIQLISMLKHDPPVAYVIKEIPQLHHEDKDASSAQPLTLPKNYETRELLEAELRALDQLKGWVKPRDTQNRFSESVVTIQSSGSTVERMGSISARASCIDCHDVEVGTTLGAFYYKLSPIKPQPIPPTNSNPEGDSDTVPKSE